jgi:hypothetical protein
VDLTHFAAERTSRAALDWRPTQPIVPPWLNRRDASHVGFLVLKSPPHNGGPFSCRSATQKRFATGSAGEPSKSTGHAQNLPGEIYHIVKDSQRAGGGPMTLWWLMFRGGSAAIIEGESLSHARLLAVANDLCRASHFVEGYSIDPALVEMIPEDFIWRRLSQQQADNMLAVMKAGHQKPITSRQARQSQAA